MAPHTLQQTNRLLIARAALFRPAWRLGVAVFVAVVCCVASLPAQTRLYEQRPFDRITLDPANDNEVLDVLPLNDIFPDRRLPEDWRRPGKLLLEKVDEPGTQYECYWRNIVKIELFEQLILNEVRGLVAARKFDEAYEYFLHLENEKPDLPGLAVAFDEYLYAEAGVCHVAGQFDLALARLREIHERSPGRPGLDRVLGVATNKLIEENVNAREYWLARQFMDNLAAMYPDHAVVADWTTRLKQKASVFLDEARKQVDEGRLREAHATLRKMTEIWPDLKGSREVQREIAALYPRYVVGVLSPATVNVPGRLHDWASRRTGRLVDRTLLEFLGPGIEGGRYVCPLGKMKTEDLGRKLEFRLFPDIAVSGGNETLTGYDLARQFLAMADPSSPEYMQLWCDLFQSVRVDDIYTTVAELRRPFVLPKAMLQTSVAPSAATFGGKPARGTIGPYYFDSVENGGAVFLTNTAYFAGGTSRPKEIVEQHFEKGTEMLSALRRGQIDVVDRINPWEVEKARNFQGVSVKRYAVPVIHCLIPNPKGPLSSRRAFRRALVFGINRDAILNLLLRGAELPGCRVISGPFSAGVSLDDPLDYAYEESIEPRSYEPHLAVVLAEVALKELTEERKKKEEPLEGVPKTVLAYPPTEAARLAVRQIERQLKIVGINVELRELGPEIPERIPDDVDLMYAEIAMWDPIVDADRLLGEDGPMGEVSPYMRQALLRLRTAVNWVKVGERCREIHQRAHSEVTIIPLWQMSNFFAHSNNLVGIGDDPVTLYQDVEDWHTRLQSKP